MLSDKRSRTFMGLLPDEEREELVEMHRPPRCLCRLNDSKRTGWDLFVMVLATFNVFQIPFNVAFEPPFMDTLYFEIINGSIDFLFLVDIIVSFRTTSIDPTSGDEVTDPMEIARRYFKGRFWIDALATVPFDKLGEVIVRENSILALQLFGLLKLVRVLRLGRLIAYLNLKDDVKMSLKLGKLVFFLVIYIHCYGCLWFLIVKSNELWVPPVDYVWVDTTVYQETV